MHGHNIKALCRLAAKSFNETLGYIELVFFAALHEFIGHTHAVFNFHGGDGDRRGGAAAVALCAVFGYNVNALIHAKYEFRGTGEGDGIFILQPCDGGMSLNRIEHFTHNFFGQIAHAANYVSHNSFVLS